MFPRNAGGTDGPLVSLCDTDHATLHKIADRLHSKKPFKDLLIGREGTAQKRLVWLAAMVVKAEKSVEGDANKLVLNSVKLTRQDTEMLKRLQPLYPKLGRSDILRQALLHLYLAKFPR